MAELRACQHCAGTILDPQQRTCPHCLEPLSTRSFHKREDLERFREDRRAHGAPVVDDGGSDTSNALALVLAGAATIMIVAGGAIVYGGFLSGGAAGITRAMGQAIVPLAMGLGLFEMARRYGGAAE